ncbi:MAG: DUF971 domain-containing protein [Spirochaetia bacterium]|nr:DUF971 domain-containing protein [Spirochaetia bacterium]
MLDTIPEKIEHDQTHLKIKWKDGKECSYELLNLRRSCPCANCRGGHEIVSKRTTDHIKTISLAAWKKVGRYALQITWSDNHDLGIYTYDALRAACNDGTQYAPPGER